MTISGFKKIYFTAMALVAALLLVFSFVTFYVGGGSSSIESATVVSTAEKIADYERSPYSSTNDLVRASNEIGSYLSGKFNNLTAMRKGDWSDISSDDTKITEETTKSGDVINSTYDGKTPSYLFMNFNASNIDMGVDDDTCYDMTGGHTNIIPAKQPRNHIVIIPGTESKTGNGTGDAVMFMTHYDSMPNSTGATNSLNVAAMLNVIDYAREQTYANDLVFVFTDGRFEDSVSAYAFKNQFEGLNKVFSRVKAAFNFDAITAGGHLAVVQTSEYDAGIISAFSSAAGSTYSDSILSAVQTNIISSDFDIFYDKEIEEWVVPSINLMFINGKYDAESKYDTLDQIDGANVAAQSTALMQKLSDKFGNIDLDNMSSGMESAYAYYLGGTVSANAALIYVLAALLLVFGGIVVFFIAKKSGKGGVIGMLKGFALAIGITAVSVGIFYAAYFLIGILMFAFGTISLNMIMTMQYLTAAILVPSIFFAAAVSCGLYPLLKRAFRIKANDCVRGASLVMILFASIVGFAYPPAALQLIIIGYCLAAVMLAVTLLAPVIKNKFGTDIHRFMPYAWPMMFAVPFIIPAILAMCNMYLTMILPALLGIFTLMLACITPYFDFLKAPLSAAFAKLPKHKIVVDQSVSREVEDTAKKGKFETVTTREILTKEVAWKYHNWFGVTVICTITAVVLLVCGLISSFAGIAYGSSVVSTYNHTNDNTYESIYSNSLIYYVEKGSDSVTSSSFLIKDESFFVKTRPVQVEGRHFVNDFDWSDTLGAYQHPLTYVEEEHPVKRGNVIASKATAEEGVAFSVNVSPYTDNSQAVLTFDNTSGVDSIKVTSLGGKDFTIDVSSTPSSMTITLPYNFGECTIDFYGSMDSSHLSAYEYIFDSSKMQAKVTNEYMSSMTEYYPEADYGMIIKYSYQL